MQGRNLDRIAPELNPAAVNVRLQTVPFQAKHTTATVNLDDLIKRGIEPNVTNILAHLGLTDFRGLVELDGRIIHASQSGRVFPHPGCLMNIVRVPHGGGGDGGKDLKRTLTSIAILATASWLAGPILGGQFGLWTSGSLAKGLATTAIASLMSKSLIPPQNQAMPSNLAKANDPSQRAFSITGFQNTPNPNGPYPVPYGKHKQFPTPGAEPYTEICGGDLYLRQLFNLGYGPVDVSSIKIGETAIADYDSVDYNIKQGYPDDTALSLYTNDVHTEAVDAIVVHATPVVRTTEAATTRISVDLCFKGGLFQIDAAGTKTQQTVEILIEYSVTGAGVWSTATTLTVTEESHSVVWKNYSWDIASGQYDVRVTRNTADSSSDSIYDEFYFYALKSIAASAPTTMTGMGQIEMRIKATDQLNGIIDRLSCIVERYLPVYVGQYTDLAGVAAINGWTSSSTDLDALFNAGDYIQVSGFTDDDNNWNYRPASSATMAKVATVGAFAITFTNLVTVANEAPGNTIYIWKLTKTRSPVWAYLDMCRGHATLHPVADTKISIANFVAWEVNCAAAGYKFDYVLDTETTQKQIMDIAAACGRARYGRLDGLISIVEDVQQTEIKQMITNRNSKGLRGHKTFVSQPHAIRLEFVNEDADYGDDELIVYFTGYDENNATEFLTVRLIGVVDSDQVWKEGKYRLAGIEHRPETFTVDMNFQHLKIDGPGNLVLLQNDAILAGIRAARITALTEDGDDITHITVDDTCTMEAGIDYGVTIRLSDNTFILSEQVATNAGDQTTLEFTTPIGIADPRPAIGDLVDFGVLNAEALRCIVNKVHMRDEDSAMLELLQEGPSIYTSDTGAIPSYTSNITIPAAAKQKLPPAPVLLNIRSDESVMMRQGRKGDWITRVLMSFAPPTQIGVPAKYYECRYKRANQTQWIKDPAVLAESNEITVIGLEDAVVYDFQVRSISEYGLASDWTTCSAALTAYTVIGKSSDPSDITDLAVAITGEKIGASWTKVVDKDVSDYELRIGLTTVWDDMATITPQKTGDADHWLLDALPAGTYYVGIKALDSTGNYSNAADTAALTITGPLTPVDDGTFVDLNVVELRWRDSTQSFPIQHYRILRGSTEPSGKLVGYAKATLKSVPELVVGPYTYWIIAVDIAGNESSAMSIAMTVVTPAGVGRIENIADDLSGVIALAKVQTVAGVPYLFAPINLTETWETHHTGNSKTTFQQFITAGFTKFSEPTPVPTNAGNKTTTCYYFPVQLNHGSGDFTKLLTTGCKIKFDYEKVNCVGSVGVYCWIGVVGVERDGVTPLTESIAATEMTISANFGYVNQVNVYLYFFTPDSTGKNLARLWDLKTLFVYPLKEETQDVVTDASGDATVTFTTIFSEILAVIPTPKTSSDYRAVAYDYSCDGNNVTIPATAEIKQHNAAGVGVAGPVNVHTRGI